MRSSRAAAAAVSSAARSIETGRVTAGNAVARRRLGHDAHRDPPRREILLGLRDGVRAEVEDAGGEHRVCLAGREAVGEVFEGPYSTRGDCLLYTSPSPRD